MKKVFLTSGPRGSGKSEYAKSIASQHPEISFISRDEMLISVFGKTMLDSYGGGHSYVEELIFEKIAEFLSEDNSTEIILIDCWNGYSSQRRNFIKKLKEFGADEVICLFFIITEDLCVEWFKKKPEAEGGLSEYSVRRDYNTYYSYAKDIEENGFDNIITINSNQLSLALV